MTSVRRRVGFSFALAFHRCAVSARGASSFGSATSRAAKRKNGFFAKNKFLLEKVRDVIEWRFGKNAFYDWWLRLCNYKFGVVIDEGSKQNITVADEMQSLQRKYNYLLSRHGKCLEDYIKKCTEYDTQKSELLKTLQPELEAARNYYHNKENRFNDVKGEYYRLQQSVKARMDQRDMHLRTEDLKVALKTESVQALQDEIAVNENAIQLNTQMYKGSDVLQKIVAGLHERIDELNSERKTLQKSISEMCKLREQLGTSNKDADERDKELLLKYNREWWLVAEQEKEDAFRMYKDKKRICDEGWDRVYKTELERNKLASELSKLTSDLTNSVNRKFDKSQDISEHTVNVSILTTVVNMILYAVFFAAGSALHLYTQSKLSFKIVDMNNIVASMRDDINAALKVDSRDITALKETISELRSDIAKLQSGSEVIANEYDSEKDSSEAVSNNDIAIQPPESKDTSCDDWLSSVYQARDMFAAQHVYFMGSVVGCFIVQSVLATYLKGS